MKPAIFHAVAALALALFVFDADAADPPSGVRATPGSVVPSSGTTASAPQGAAAPARTPATPRVARTAGSLSGPPPPDCAAMRSRYAESQACFAPYRLANGGIKPEAFKRCRDVADPALTCGPATAAPE